MTILNIFHSGGLFLIPIVLFLASLYCFYRTSIIRKGGMEYTDSNPNSPTFGKTSPVAGKPAYSKIGVFIFGVVLLAAAVISLAVIASDYRGV